jgi:hypothetical protein
MEINALFVELQNACQCNPEFAKAVKGYLTNYDDNASNPAQSSIDTIINFKIKAQEESQKRYTDEAIKKANEEASASANKMREEIIIKNEGLEKNVNDAISELRSQNLLLKSVTKEMGKAFIEFFTSQGQGIVLDIYTPFTNFDARKFFEEHLDDSLRPFFSFQDGKANKNKGAAALLLTLCGDSRWVMEIKKETASQLRDNYNTLIYIIFNSVGKASECGELGFKEEELRGYNVARPDGALQLLINSKFGSREPHGNKAAFSKLVETKFKAEIEAFKMKQKAQSLGELVSALGN